jgi:RimJ/RimL family protein N-acetyltransferase
LVVRRLDYLDAEHNVAGSAGDLLMIAWLLFQPSAVLVEDHEAVFTIYGPKIGPDAVKIHITTTSEADLPDLLRLWNDGRVMQWVGFADGLGYDAAAMRVWFERLQGSPQRHHYVIRNPEGQFCGELYYAVDEAQRRASLDIKLLPEAQGRGVATQALRRLIDHVFAAEPAVDAAWTEPSGNNRAARRLYARCGLKPTNRPADLPPAESYWEIQRHDRPHGHEHDPLLSG